MWWGVGAFGLLLVVMAGLLVWWPWHCQNKTLSEIRRSGGGDLSEPVGPEWLRDLVGVEVMAGFDHVILVKFDDRVTDAGLVHLRSLTELRELQLDGTSVTNAGLTHLEKLPNLRILYLDGTNVTDAGLVHLKELPKLQTLGLSSTKVTDSGLAKLRELPKLKWLNIAETRVTDDGVKKLQAALPKCEVRR